PPPGRFDPYWRPYRPANFAPLLSEGRQRRLIHSTNLNVVDQQFPCAAVQADPDNRLAGGQRHADFPALGPPREGSRPISQPAAADRRPAAVVERDDQRSLLRLVRSRLQLAPHDLA